jgi:hypothetical protein
VCLTHRLQSQCASHTSHMHWHGDAPMAVPRQHTLGVLKRMLAHSDKNVGIWCSGLPIMFKRLPPNSHIPPFITLITLFCRYLPMLTDATRSSATADRSGTKFRSSSRFCSRTRPICFSVTASRCVCGSAGSPRCRSPASRHRGLPRRRRHGRHLQVPSGSSFIPPKEPLRGQLLFGLSGVDFPHHSTQRESSPGLGRCRSLLM